MSRKERTSPLFISLHWLPIAARIKFKALMFAYKTTTTIPKSHKIPFTDFYIKCSLLVEWPAQLNLSIFKNELKTHLFHLYLTL